MFYCFRALLKYWYNKLYQVLLLHIWF